MPQTQSQLKSWQKTKLGDIANFQYGYTASADEKNTGTKFLRITDIVPDLIDWDTVPFCDIKEEKANQYKIHRGDILIARTGATAGYAKLIRKEPEQSVFASYLIRLKIKDKNVSPEFIGRIIESEAFKQFVSSHIGGAAQPHANAPVLKNFEISVPPFLTQKQIADVLSVYDDLIENNTKRIRILEQIAQAIYKEWFISFVNVNKLPKGWKLLQVEKLVKRVSPGKLHDNKSALEKGRVPILDQGKSGIIGYHNDAPGVKASIENPIIVFANHTCYQRLILFPFSAIQNVLPFYPSEESYRNIFWLHYATKDLIEFNDYKGHWPEFMQKEVVVPPVDLAEKFGREIKSLIVLSYQLELENKNLRQARDLLLPKLVTGEIRV